MSCESEGNSWSVSLGGSELALSVQPTPAATPCSRVLFVHARHRLLNRTGRPLRYSAAAGGPSGWLSATQDVAQPIQWSGAAASSEQRWIRLTLAAAPSAADWSGAFVVDKGVEKGGDLVVQARGGRSGGDLYVQVTVEVVGGSFLVCFDAVRARLLSLSRSIGFISPARRALAC